MELNLSYSSIKKLAFFGPKSRYLILYKNGKEFSSLYIQKPDLFSINLLSNLERLKNNEFDEIKYMTSKDELISIKTLNSDQYILNYISNNINNIDKLKEILKK